MQKWCKCGYPIESLYGRMSSGDEGYTYLDNQQEMSITHCPQCEEKLTQDMLVDEKLEVEKVLTLSGDWTPGYFVLNLEQASQLVGAGIPHEVLESDWRRLPNNQMVVALLVRVDVMGGERWWCDDCETTWIQTKGVPKECPRCGSIGQIHKTPPDRGWPNRRAEETEILTQMDEARRMRGSLETELVSEGDGKDLELRQAFFETAVEVANNFVVSVNESGFWIVPENMARRLYEAWVLMEGGEASSVEDIPVLELWPGEGHPPPINESPKGWQVQVAGRGVGTVVSQSSSDCIPTLMVHFDDEDSPVQMDAHEFYWIHLIGRETTWDV